ncbi:MAG: acetate/propionate family kinase [Pirellulaceae bacterium]|nr:acetate/propionate family kinase [Pirellulaceae bacterium]
MSEAILVLNAGSSSLKFAVFLDSDPPEPLLRGQVEGLFTRPHFVARNTAGSVISELEWPAGSQLGHAGAIDHLFRWGRDELGEHRISAAGHRVGHGGRKFLRPVLVDAEVLAALEALVPLAPLHQPHNLAAIKAVSDRAPEIPQVACFDTAFHRRQPAVAQSLGLPRRFADEGVLRYGFHGLSYEYIAAVLSDVDPQAAAGRTVVAHLGSGASMCAMQGGMSIATTMGFTPLDGLLMGTRCGAIDPGVLLYLMDAHGLDARGIEKLLYQQSGLLGVSGISNDMRALLECESNDTRAKEAINLFVYRISRELGSLAAALGGLDALVFTGGIGEHSAQIRARVCREAAWLGLEFDSTSNEGGGPRLSRVDSPVSAWVIPTNEELMIARHTRHVLRRSA